MTVYRKDHIQIDHFANLYAEITDGSENSRSILDQFNTNKINSHYCAEPEGKTADNQYILDLNEIKALIHSRETNLSQGSFWTSENQFDHQLSDYLLTHLDRSALYELIPHRMPFSKPPGDDPIANLLDFFDVIIGDLKKLQTSGFDSQEPWKKNEEVWNDFYEKYGYGGYASIYETRFQQYPTILPFTLFPGEYLSQPFTSDSILASLNLTPYGNQIPLRNDQELFLHMVTDFWGNPFAVKILLLKAYEKAAKNDPDRKLKIAYSHPENITTQSIEPMILFLEDMKEYIQKEGEDFYEAHSGEVFGGSVQIDEQNVISDEVSIDSRQRDYQLYQLKTSHDQQNFIEGPLQEYLYIISITSAGDPRQITADDELKKEAQKHLGDSDLKIFNQGLDDFLKNYGYSRNTCEFKEISTGRIYEIQYLTRITGIQFYQGIIDNRIVKPQSISYQNSSYSEKVVPGESINLINQLYQDPQWQLQNSLYKSLIYFPGVEWGSQAWSEIAGNSKHPFHELAKNTQSNSPQHWEEIYEAFQNDVKTYARLVQPSVEYYRGQSDLASANALHPEKVQAVHYALWQSEDPLSVFLILYYHFMKEQTSSREIIGVILKSLLSKLKLESSTKALKTNSDFELGIIYEETNATNIWNDLSRIDMDKATQRVALILSQNPNAIREQLEATYYGQEYLMNGENSYYRIDDYSDYVDYQPLNQHQDWKKQRPQSLGLSIDRILKFRPRWQDLARQLNEADKDLNGRLNIMEFLQYPFSQPVQSFLKTFLARHPRVLHSLIPLREFQRSQDFWLEMGLDLDHQDQNITDTRPQLLEAYKNLPLIPASTLLKMIEYCEDNTFKHQLWVVVCREDTNSALDLWTKLVTLWVDGKNYKNRQINEIDLFTPLEYFAGIHDSRVNQTVLKLKSKLDELDKEGHYHHPQMLLIKALWTQSPEIIPWELLRERVHFSFEKSMLPDGTIYQKEQTQESLIRFQMSGPIIKELSRLHFLHPDYPQTEYESGLDVFKDMPAWQRELIMVLVWQQDYNWSQNPQAKVSHWNEVIDNLNFIIINNPNFLIKKQAEATLDQFIGLTDFYLNKTSQPSETQLNSEMNPSSFQPSPEQNVAFSTQTDEAIQHLSKTPKKDLITLNHLKNLWNISQKTGEFEAKQKAIQTLKELILPLPEESRLRADLYETMLIMGIKNWGSDLDKINPLFDFLEKQTSPEVLTRYMVRIAFDTLDNDGLVTPVESVNLLKFYSALNFYLKRGTLKSEIWISETMSNNLALKKSVLGLFFFALLENDHSLAQDYLVNTQDLNLPRWNADERARDKLERTLFNQPHLFQHYQVQEHQAILKNYLHHPLGQKDFDYSIFQLWLEPQTTFERLGQRTLSFYLGTESDKNAIPTDSLAQDMSYISGEDLEGYRSGGNGLKDRSRQSYHQLLTAVLEVSILIKQNKMNSEDVTALRSWASQARQTPTTSQLYPWLLAGLATSTGDQGAQESLWEFYSRETRTQDLQHNLHVLEVAGTKNIPYEHPYDNTLAVIERILLSVDASRFFRGTPRPERPHDQPRTLIMIEGGYADPNTPNIAELEYRNPQAGLNTSVEHSTHATSVAQVLSNGEDKVINYAVDLEENLYPQLAMILEDVYRLSQDSSIIIGGFNISLGMDSSLESYGYHDDSTTNPDFSRCQELIQRLNKAGIEPIAAAGNSGTQLDEKIPAFGLAGGIANHLGSLGPEVYLVGSYHYEPTRPTTLFPGVIPLNTIQEISEFSSRGGSEYRNASLAPGEGWTFWTTGGESVETQAGTSFSSPFMTTISADQSLLNPRLSGTEKAWIRNVTAEDLGAFYPEDHGYGQVMANRAYFVSWYLSPGWKTRSEVSLMAEKFGVSGEARELQWVANQIRWQRLTQINPELKNLEGWGDSI